jgi:hypothetical protein
LALPYIEGKGCAACHVCESNNKEGFIMSPSLDLLISIGEEPLERAVTLMRSGWCGESIARQLRQEPRHWDGMWIAMSKVAEFASLGKEKTFAVMMGLQDDLVGIALRRLRLQSSNGTEA